MKLHVEDDFANFISDLIIIVTYIYILKLKLMNVKLILV